LPSYVTDRVGPDGGGGGGGELAMTALAVAAVPSAKFAVNVAVAPTGK
jgi:hypothetical protein